MFIARSNPHLRRRSEEREASCVLRASSFPLLRTASGWRSGGGYKHATPNGVKKCLWQLRTSPEMIAEKQNSKRKWRVQGQKGGSKWESLIGYVRPAVIGTR